MGHYDDGYEADVEYRRKLVKDEIAKMSDSHIKVELATMRAAELTVAEITQIQQPMKSAQLRRLYTELRLKKIY